MRRFLTTAMLVAASFGLMNAQTARKQVVENGGTGPYKAEVVEDVSSPKFTTYRPQNLKSVVAKTGKLPIIVYANGGCANNNVEMRFLLSEVASHGYVAIAIGPYDEEDVVAKWKDVLTFSYPETSQCDKSTLIRLYFNPFCLKIHFYSQNVANFLYKLLFTANS